LQSAFLEVVIPPDIISEETSNDLMVPEGGSAKLVCKARGYPKPEIVWKREDGAEIISRTSHTGSKTKRKESGVLFQCRSVSLLGEIRRRYKANAFLRGTVGSIKMDPAGIVANIRI